MLGWGSMAFGAYDPSAYTPLLLASPVLGIIGLWIGRSRTRPSNIFLFSLFSVALAIVAQLLPLSMSTLSWLSPHAIPLIEQVNLAFNLDRMAWHPLSIEPSRTWLALGFFGSFGVLLVGASRGFSRAGGRRFSGGLVWLGVVLATVGIIQQATHTRKIYGFWELVQGGAPFGPFVNKNHFAGWMLMALPVSFGYFASQLNRGMRQRRAGLRNLVLSFASAETNTAVLAGFGVLIMTFALLLTMSRSGIAVFGLMLVAAGVVSISRQKNLSGRIVILSHLLVFIVAVVSWVGADRIISRFAQIDLENINERPAIWADTVRIARDFYLTGTGLNTYGVSTLFYQTAVPDQHLREAHNDYLQLSAEGGVLILVPFFLVVAALAVEIRRRFREDAGSVIWIRAGAVAGLVAIALQSTVEFSLQMPGNAALFAVITGLAIHDSQSAARS